MCIRDSGMTLSTMVERTMQAAGRRSVRRLYVGSNFCSQYFLRQPDQVWREAFSFCRREGIPATLVVPVFSPVSYTHLDVYKRQRPCR